MKIFIAQTIDGFIAGPDGSLDHLEAFMGNDYGYDAFIASVDAVVLGRRTFDSIYTDHGWTYPEGLPGIVITSRALPAGVPKNVSTATDIAAVAAKYPDAYVDGGVTIRQSVDLDLVREARIFTLPLLLGSGSRLFPDAEHSLRTWTLVELKQFPCGTSMSHYTA